MTMREGELVGGRYRLHARLGRGGMGHVFRATDERLRREVAIKVVDLSQSLDASVGPRFHREALATAKLNHPGIVTIFDADTDARLAFLVMELLPGRTLAEVLRADGPLAQRRAVTIARKIADALVATHAIGVVHRDIKPANIMVDGDAVKLLDFGIALAQKDAEVHLTAPATTLGTAAYMSPEQAQGLRATAASDVYALGGVLMAMLTGAPPYAGDNAIQVANRHLTEPVPDVRARRPEVSEPLADLLTRMLGKDPMARHSGALVATALAHLESNPGADATSVLPAAAAAAAAIPAAAASVRPDPTAVLPAATAVLPAATRIEPGQATRIEPVPVQRDATTARPAARPDGSEPQPAATSVLPTQDAGMPHAYAFAGEGAGGRPASARRAGVGADPGDARGPVDVRRYKTAAAWIGVTVAAALVFMVMWGLGSQLVGQRGATPAPSASAAPSSSSPPTSAKPTSTKPSTPAPTSKPTATPAQPSSPVGQVTSALGDAAKKAALGAALKGVDAAFSTLQGEDSPPLIKLEQQWQAASADVAAGKKPGQAVDKFAEQVDRAAEKGDITGFEAQALKLALSGVRAAL